jgi:hypothetical protein
MSLKVSADFPIVISSLVDCSKRTQATLCLSRTLSNEIEKVRSSNSEGVIKYIIGLSCCILIKLLGTVFWKINIFEKMKVLLFLILL